MKCVAYKDGYKYQLFEPYQLTIDILPEKDLSVDGYVILTKAGELFIQRGYAWDGPSGPTFDTLNFMRGSLVHDALYQLMRNELLDAQKYKEPADRLLQKICKEDGMNAIRAWIIYQGLQIGGKAATLKKNEKVVIKAPKSCN